MANSMRTALRHFRAPPMHFRSHDVINVIFGKTAINVHFLSYRLQVKSKLIRDVISNDLNHHNDKFLQNNGRKTSFKNVTMVTKILTCYISVTVRDRPVVTIIHR